MSAEAGIFNGFVTTELVNEMIIYQQAQINQFPAAPRLDVVLSSVRSYDPFCNAYEANSSYAMQLGEHGRLVGVQTQTHVTGDMTKSQIMGLIEELNDNPDVDGIIPMLPAPTSALDKAIRDTIAPHKDVDGVGSSGGPFIPATPEAMVRTAEYMLGRTIDHDAELGGIAIIGSGEVVGRPLFDLLQEREVPGVTVLADKIQITEHISELHDFARVIFSAVPVAGIIRQEYLAKGSVIVDVGFGIDRATQKPCGNVHPEVFQDPDLRATSFRNSVGRVTAAIIHERTILQAAKRLGAGRTDQGQAASPLSLSTAS